MYQTEAKQILESGDNIFLTGEAGTGKTWLMKEFIAEQKKKGKKVVITAPTGVAALNIGGATLHSTFKVLGMYPEKRPPKDQDITWTEIDIVVIDEISMVGPDMLDQIEFVLRRCGKNSYLPFGGIQVIVIGDLYQLPPVYAPFTTKDKEQFKELQTKYTILTADNAQCFSSFQRVELTEVKRQENKEFAQAINLLRNGFVNILDSLQQGIGTEHSVHLVPTNAMADDMNMNKFVDLQEEWKTYHGIFTGEFNKRNAITPEELHIKKGARVMITKNLTDFGLVNGDVGTVDSFDGGGVSFSSDRLGTVIYIPRATWKQIEYHGYEPVEIGSYTQIPMKLAWAITIHKSQGLSLDDVCLHVKKGMARDLIYVGASRATSLGGLWIHRV